MDIVRILESYALSKGMVYDYGTKAALNLIEQGEEWEGYTDKIYFLHEFRKGKPLMNATKTRAEGTEYTGKFYLTMHSDYAATFFKDVSDSASSGTDYEGKYQKHIEPLIKEIDKFSNFVGCSLMELRFLEWLDVTDFLDANLTGLLINYTIYVPNAYTSTAT